MFYKPIYCCNCGEKVERVKWGITTSRRFCQSCESDFVGQEWLPRLIVIIGVVGILYGFGSLLRKPEKTLSVTTAQTSVSPDAAANQKYRQLSANANVQISAPAANAANRIDEAAKKQNLFDPKTAANLRLQSAGNYSDRQKATPEAVYFCGAQTKKGTPCSRRVKGGGRCWQHAGQTALLPPEKLLISQ